MTTIKKPILTEKSTDLLDKNKMTFIVDIDSDKPEIKTTVEEVYDTAVSKVNTMITPTGEKKAYVKFEEEGEAENLATRLGIF